MKKSYTYIIPLFTLFLSCKEEAQKPKVRYEKPKSTVEIKQDTSKLQVADLPVQLDNASTLVYPIGDLRVSDVQKGKFEDSRSNDEKINFNISNSIENEITGYLRNIKFQKIGTDSLHILTDKMVLIERMTYLKDKKVFVYVLADSDTNQDNNVDSDDIKSLYLSTDMGKNFKKISPDIEELIDWNYIEGTGKIFF